MKQLNFILQRAIAGPFYRRNSGFFLFLIFLLFGMYPSFVDTIRFHSVLMKGILTTPSFFVIATIVWLAYAAKIIHFFYGCIKTRNYDFLQDLNALPFRNRFFYLFRLQFLLMLPVLLYCCIVIGVGMKNSYWSGSAVLVLSLLMICLFVTVTFNSLLQKTKNAWLRIPRLTLNLPGNLSTFLLRFIFSEQILLLVVLKLVSFSSIYFFSQNDTALFEERMLWFIFLTSLSAHCILIYRNHYFIETKMAFYRNMPVKRITTITALLLVYIILLFPEFWALKGLIIRQHAVTTYCWMIITGPAILLFLHCLLYTDDMKIEEFLKLVFGVWLVAIFFSMSSVRFILPLALFAMAALTFFTCWYKYEKNATIEKLE